MTYFERLARAVVELPQEPLNALLLAVRECLSRRGTVYLCGNGGSFANALHWACDLTKVAGIRTHVLGVNSSLATARANDDGYTHVLNQELELYGRPRDLLIVLSCSGTSPNVVAAMRQAVLLDIPYIIVTSHCWRPESGTTAALTEIVVPAKDYTIIEDCHAAIGHWLTEHL